MPETQNSRWVSFKRIILPFFGLVAIAACIGFIFGIFAGHAEKGGGPMPSKLIIEVVIAVALIILLSFYFIAPVKRLVVGEPDLTKRERLNKNVILGGTALGIVLAVIFVLLTEDANHSSNILFSNTQITLTAAIITSIFIGIIIPISTYFWLSIVDEQELSAYRDGAYYSANGFLFLAPVWWLLWRAKLAPEPNVMICVIALSIVWTAVWFWKKYA